MISAIARGAAGIGKIVAWAILLPFLVAYFLAVLVVYVVSVLAVATLFRSRSS